MELARKREIDVVLVWKFDRFARSTQQLRGTFEEFRELGVDVISYTENIDTSTPMGRTIFTIVSAIAGFERDLIRERVRAGLDRGLRACSWTEARSPPCSSPSSGGSGAKA